MTPADTHRAERAALKRHAETVANLVAVVNQVRRKAESLVRACGDMPGDAVYIGNPDADPEKYQAPPPPQATGSCDVLHGPRADLSTLCLRCREPLKLLRQVLEDMRVPDATEGTGVGLD